LPSEEQFDPEEMMRFAKFVFWIVGVWGLLVLTPPRSFGATLEQSKKGLKLISATKATT